MHALRLAHEDTILMIHDAALVGDQRGYLKAVEPWWALTAHKGLPVSEAVLQAFYTKRLDHAQIKKFFPYGSLTVFKARPGAIAEARNGSKRYLAELDALRDNYQRR